MLVTVPGSTRFLAKRSLFRIPVFGWGLRAAGFVPVDREDRSRAKEAMDGAIEQLAKGRSILLFPEETRSLDGRIREFQVSLRSFAEKTTVSASANVMMSVAVAFLPSGSVAVVVIVQVLSGRVQVPPPKPP